MSETAQRLLTRSTPAQGASCGCDMHQPALQAVVDRRFKLIELLLDLGIDLRDTLGVEYVLVCLQI